jgi:hypothetical protein
MSVKWEVIKIDELKRKLKAANEAGRKLARCYRWDREEYQTNHTLVRAVEADAVARRWMRQNIKEVENRSASGAGKKAMKLNSAKTKAADAHLIR